MGTFKSYLLGFILSTALTATAFLIVINRLLAGWNLIIVIVGLALIQLWVQLIFFLHLGVSKNSYWNLAVFLSTASVIFILVAGSLWIMKNLNYSHMTSSETDTYILHQEGMQR